MSAPSATICSARSASWPSATARSGARTRAAVSCASTLTAASNSSRRRIDTRFGRGARSEPSATCCRARCPTGWHSRDNGDFLIANFGTDALERMTRDGREPRAVHARSTAQPLGKANFVLRDSRQRIWLTVTTRAKPWTRSINEKLADGYVALIDERGIRIAADGFVGTNEIRLDANEEWLYVVESNARRISRLRVRRRRPADGPRESTARRSSRAFRTDLPSMPSATCG